MRQRIRLTESDLHRIVKTAVRRVLKESDFPSSGCKRVRMGDKYNWADPDGNIISDTWFDDDDRFRHDVPSSDCKRVRIGNKYNWADPNGNIISDTWFDD